MAIDSIQRHRAGNLKQQNKLHKHGRHRSKGSLEKLNKGRTNALKINLKKRQELSREERRNQASQIRKNKRCEYLQKRREICEAPFLVAFIPLNSEVNADDTVKKLIEADPEATTIINSENHLHLSSPRLKQKFTFVKNAGDNLFDTLDLLKVADTVVFLVPVEGVDDAGEITLAAILAQGLPTCTTMCTDLDSVPPKKRQDKKMKVQEEIERWLPGEKIHSLDKSSDALLVLRKIALQKQKPIAMRDRRPHLLAEEVHFLESTNGCGTLKVTGYLRGQSLDVNSLIHIPGWGDFKMSLIEAPQDPLSGREQPTKLLETADPTKQESLETENPVDPMDAEQTWPTEEEMRDVEIKKKKVKKVPHGMSEYQASWIPDDDAVELEEGSEDEEDEAMEAVSDSENEEEGEMDDDDGTGTVTSEVAPLPEKYDLQVDIAEEELALRTIREAEEDKQFPDEMDTPRETPARERFAKYRGLASFRTTPWDPKENLPSDYARIFQFKNFDRTKKIVLKEQEDASGALPGWYITVHIMDVPTYLYQSRETQPIVLYGLLKHEQKMSVVNMVLRRPVGTQEEPIKSKHPLLIQCGFRRYKCKPIFSQHTKGNKFKYERFFHPDATVVATTFAPIIFPPASVLAFVENKDGTLSLVATGSILSVDPNRIIVKRVVLSGHPYKVNKRSAVIRFMFFNREDIDWFKPVELRTKYGRRGHIKEPLGTHGHMKCVFNGQLKSQDTVLLNLFKRVYPKWTYDPQVTFSIKEEEENTMEEDNT